MRQPVAAEVTAPLVETDGRALRIATTPTSHRAVASLVLDLPTPRPAFSFDLFRSDLPSLDLQGVS